MIKYFTSRRNFIWEITNDLLQDNKETYKKGHGCPSITFSKPEIQDRNAMLRMWQNIKKRFYYERISNHAKQFTPNATGNNWEV